MSAAEPERPLGTTTAGERVRLVRVMGGRGIRQRLSAMGLLPGTYMTVISNSAPGPIKVAVKEARLVLGRGMVNRIIVA